MAKILAPYRNPARFDFDIVGLGAINIDHIVSGLASRLPLRNRETVLEISDYEDLEHDLENFIWTVGQIGKRRNTTARTLYGGSTFNTLSALSRMGLGLRLGFVGVAPSPPYAQLPRDRSGEAISPRDALRDLGIEFEGPAAHAGPGGLVVSWVRGGKRSLYTYFDDQVPASLEADAERIARVISRSRVVHVTSIYGTQSTAVVLGILHRARSLNKRLTISLDPGDVWTKDFAKDGHLREIYSLADYLFVNGDEYKRLGAQDADDAEFPAQFLGGHKQKPSLIVLKNGHESTVFSLRDGVVDRATVPASVLPLSRIADPTGAGDTFAAGFLGALLSERGALIGALHSGLLAARVKLQGLADDAHGALLDAYGQRPTRKAKRVFVSHSTTDPAWAEAVSRMLEACGLQVFCTSYRDHGIEAGTSDWLAEIPWELGRADLVVALVSEDFMDSHMCLHEIGGAWLLGTQIFPILDESCPPSKIGYVLGRIEAERFNARTLDKLYEVLGEEGLARPSDLGQWQAIRDSAIESFRLRPRPRRPRRWRWTRRR